jgi:hypothetical protein
MQIKWEYNAITVRCPRQGRGKSLALWKRAGSDAQGLRSHRIRELQPHTA